MKKELSQLPVLPTEFTKNFYVDQIEMRAGWYAVKFDPDTFTEGLNGNEICFNSFEKCKQACDIHNKWLGMSIISITKMYQAMRFAQVFC